MELHHIPQACLSYAYLLCGKTAFRETLRIRGKVKKGKLKGNPEKLSTFVRVILHNVTLETEVDKGDSPTWDEEFVL
ncbi:PREDICTED: protein unc-13 homolog B-like [Acropora digitifera]|uniref:protein unc-13 homolog B-like n=1 Tax=Acropora digitifera TaxID=70779 RepID=UPI00077A1535|nr:PREDICTED: protein unc-13 homolog B-like [Acropora digitifera]